MATVNTSELTGPALDWAVAKCENLEVEHINDGITKFLLRLAPFTGRYSPSTDWAQGGPIIERERISTRPHDHDRHHWSAEQPLIAINPRLSSFNTGPTADIPDELA